MANNSSLNLPRFESETFSPDGVEEMSKSVFTPEFESNLRDSIRWQIDNPADLSDASTNLTREDIRFLGFGTVQQEKQI
jgi:hypothetical protein